MNIRLWKARAWEKLGLLKDRQKTALEYNEKLKEKFSSHPEVVRLLRILMIQYAIGA
jgi:WD repeat and SOF domain-containing protein 1